MYEKPQYLTPDGYRRSKKNPFRSGIPFNEAAKQLAENNNFTQNDKNENSQEIKNRPIQIKPHVAQFLKKQQNVSMKKQSPISDKAARLIAEAIRSLLKD
jgi:hypothetical protein